MFSMSLFSFREGGHECGLKKLGLLQGRFRWKTVLVMFFGALEVSHF